MMFEMRLIIWNVGNSLLENEQEMLFKALASNHKRKPWFQSDILMSMYWWKSEFDIFKKITISRLGIWNEQKSDFKRPKI